MTKKYNKTKKNEGEIIRMYKEELLSVNEIANILNCSSCPISLILKRTGTIMGCSERKKLLYDVGKLKTWNKGLPTEKQPGFEKHPTTETKKKISLSHKERWNEQEFRQRRTIELTLRNKSQEQRNKISKTVTENWKNPIIREKMIKAISEIEVSEKTKERLRTMRLGKKLSEEQKSRAGMTWRQHPPMNNPELAKKSGETRKRLIIEGKINYDKQRERMLGSKNPAWNNGSSFEPYGLEFNNQFRNKIRKRDNQVCMNCGKHREQLKKALMVHHVNYDKKLTIPENCISLCNSCHTLSNTNREYWTKLFQEKLAQLYNYKYESGQIILTIEQEK